MAFSPIKFKNDGGEASAQFRAETNRIGWVRTVANKPGASFDFVIRDMMGREMLRKINCKTETEQFAELMNIHTRIGEEITISLENIKNADDIDLFLN